MLAHTLATVFLELAYLATGILLCFMGLRLLEKGVESKTRLQGELGGQKWALLTSSPGIVFAVCGLGIIIYAIVTQADYKTILSNKVTSTTPSLATNMPTSQTMVHSRLFKQSSNDSNGLQSRIAIYALQHLSLQLKEQDVDRLITTLPKTSNIEPWPMTYDRVADILKKNPKALGKLLQQPDYLWIQQRNQRDGTLTALLDIELDRLNIITR